MPPANGRPLHHEPTRVGPDERRRFHRQYRATLALYEREFDQPPPADLWPDVARRFAGQPVRTAAAAATDGAAGFSP